MVLLLLLAPLFTYTALEISRANEQEAFLQNIYEAQLGAILFSVNQYCWDVVNGWGNFLRTEILNKPGQPSSPAAALAIVRQRYAALSGAFYSENGQIQVALPDSMHLERPDVGRRIAGALDSSATEIEKMREQANKGYWRPAVLNLHLSSSRKDLLFAFSMASDTTHLPLGGFYFSPEDFVRQVLTPKIAEFASQDFLLAVKRSGTNQIFFATQDLTAETFEREEALWVLPDMSLAIKPAGASAAQLAQRRSQQTLFLLLGLDAVILLAAVLLLRLLRRETELARLKSDFVDHVSHDLRTPLGSIRMYAETLEMGRVIGEEKRREYYGILSREAARLTKLVNNLLDFSRIEAGRREYEKKRVALAGLVREALNGYQFYLQQRGFTLVEQIDQNLPEIIADSEAVTQAFLNVLDNAVKYSEQQKHITVKLRREDNWAVIEVADQGIGIAGKHLSKIFGKFYRIEEIGRESRGAGIGLAIVQHIMEAHHGKVEVQSEPSKGSSFILKFPVQD